MESVGQLTARINSALKGFGRVAVEGEVSRPKTVASGHVFFTLKEDGAVLEACRNAATAGHAAAAALAAERVDRSYLDAFRPLVRVALKTFQAAAQGRQTDEWLERWQRDRRLLMMFGVIET